MNLGLLPGLDGTGRLFEPLVQVLPTHLSPVVVSYPNDKAQSYAELVRQAKQQVPAREDYVLLAESFSGPVAIEIAASHPANLKALILSATFVSNPALVPQSMSFLLRGLFFMLDPPQFVVSRYLLGEKPPSDFGRDLPARKALRAARRVRIQDAMCNQRRCAKSLRRLQIANSVYACQARPIGEAKEPGGDAKDQTPNDCC